MYADCSKKCKGDNKRERERGREGRETTQIDCRLFVIRL